MKKNNLFSAGAGYVSPGVKIAAVRVRRSILTVSNEPGNRWYEGGAGAYDDDEIIDNGDY